MDTLTNKIGNTLTITREPGKPLRVATMTTNPTDEYADIIKVEAEFGLRYISGNSKPYFSLTGSGWAEGDRRNSVGGQVHELIVDQLPELAELATLHMSDIDGAPIHAAANGWYWLAGACGGLGERYHGGNGTNGKSADECRAILASYLRIPVDGPDGADGLIRWAKDAECEGWLGQAREVAWPSYIDRQRPRWKAEAEAAITRFNLPVYGDRWERT